MPDRPSGHRDGLRLFSQSTRAAKGIWQAVPLEVDPVDRDGHLRFFEDEDAFMTKGVEALDLLIFRAETFGPRLIAGQRLPCHGRVTYELQDEATHQYAYLTNCSNAKAPEDSRQVTYDKTRHVLGSPVYQYTFNPDNYMQFRSIKFHGSGDGWDEIATDSKMLIRADAKNFFTMTFDSHQIESHLEASRLGPMGNLARVSFFLQVLFFKIRMSLATDVGFFSDSGHIPMMVNIPVNAYDYLNPASGIFYSWVLSPLARAGSRDIQMPILDPSLVHEGFAALAKEGLRFCKGSECRYRYTVDIHGQRLAMDLGIERPLVERGFFPLYVEDAAKVREAMDWDGEGADGDHRSGMYFEVSGLPEGGHPWDFWLRLGSPSEAPKSCPTPVTSRLLTGFF